MFDELRKKAGGVLLTLARGREDARRYLQIDILERHQAKQAGGFFIRRAVFQLRRPRWSRIIDLGESFGEARDLGETGRVCLQTDRKPGLAAQLPGGKESGSSIRLGVEAACCHR